MPRVAAPDRIVEILRERFSFNIFPVLQGGEDVNRQDARERLKAAQVRLLKIRIWRATGSRPGSA